MLCYVTLCHTLALVGWRRRRAPRRALVEAEDRSAEWRSASASLSECPLAHPPTTHVHGPLSILLPRSSCVCRCYCTHRSARPLVTVHTSIHFPSFKPGVNRVRTLPPVVLKNCVVFQNETWHQYQQPMTKPRTNAKHHADSTDSPPPRPRC